MGHTTRRDISRLALYTPDTEAIVNIGAHPGMPIDVTAAASGTEYSGKAITSTCW